MNDEPQVVYYYLNFEKKEGKSDVLSVHTIKQKVELGLESWELSPIYGTEEKVSVTVAHLEDDCIICFGEKADVVVMPCRHLCLGIECAKLLRNKQAKQRVCPICRTSKSAPSNPKISKNSSELMVSKLQEIKILREAPKFTSQTSSHRNKVKKATLVF